MRLVPSNEEVDALQDRYILESANNIQDSEIHKKEGFELAQEETSEAQLED